MKVHHCRPAVFPASPPQVFSALLKHFGSGCRPLSCDDTRPPINVGCASDGYSDSSAPPPGHFLP